MIQKISLITRVFEECNKIEYAEDVLDDLINLDGSVLKEACARIKKINDNPFCGEELQNKYGMNLSGCRKEYFNGTRMRIVWEPYSKPNEQGYVAIIWSIGPRKSKDVYRRAYKRR
jgi:mRNA interferase RelE/StbE